MIATRTRKELFDQCLDRKTRNRKFIDETTLLEPSHTGVLAMKNVINFFSALHQNVFLRTLEIHFTFDIWSEN